MKLVAGLGNPGRQYAGTRHNVGFEVVDTLARRHGLAFDGAPADALMARWRTPLADGGVLLVKPLTYMNRSGYAIAELARYFRVEIADILVIVDEIALELGRLRARARGSAGGHNGLKSVAEQLGTEEYSRLRIGVGPPPLAGLPGPGQAERRDLADHVLARFEADERLVIEDAIARAADAVETFVASGIEAVMSAYNRKEDGQESQA
ncbi:MAG TPA: aminoacyl-tRNA hydrolase [Vicinamibacterales bacterium]|nr:aminoacyl-tRNA hydrolase [Vicinamibacterales bacterium]